MRTTPNTKHQTPNTRLLSLCCGLVLLAGCGRSGPALAPVKGQVFYRGRPLAGGTIVFTPDPQRGGRGPQAWAPIAADGHYTLQTGGKKGAVPGWHQVTIAPASRAAAALPARYRDPELSGQHCEVKPDRVNHCDLHLD
jgi:hypothetical protein